jgi:hypothetical protein
MPSKTESGGASEGVSKVMLVNRRRQPVELHFGSATCVLLPGQRTPVQPEQLKLPQVAFLIARRVISVAEERQPAPKTPDESQPTEASKAAEAAEPSPESKPAEPSPPKGRGARGSAAEPKRPASPTKGKPA